MDAYFDSAIIVKLYVQEATSPDAIRLVGGYAAPYALTQWQVLEVKNAIRLKAFRSEITSAEMNQSITAFEQDIATGRWQRPAYSAAAVEHKAEELSAGHSAMLGCRTLYIIHVAAALVIGAKEFVTFDGRQGALAKQAALTVKPAI
jgi:predicted nucleic acid-binding protein